MWRDLRLGLHLAGSAAEGETKQAWSEYEQRSLCRACQAAAADQQLPEAMRLLHTQQLGLQIEDKDLAWQLVQVVAV